MTTRDQLSRAAGVDRGETTRARRSRGEPSSDGGGGTQGLPERLLTARERKGVDLYRAERDTKIRARYLAALERGDYRELPGAVYTKGFLRNYALYLGLDPDDVLLQWRRERGDGQDVRPAITVPKPIAPPRRALTFSPSLIVFAILTVAVIAFGAYLGVQLLRFAKPPTIAVTEPAVAVVEVDDSVESYVLRGMSAPGATVTIATPGRDPYRVTADADGTWAASVELRRGRNPFEVSALDPETGKASESSVALEINVPFLTIEAPTLTVDQPAEGATYENGAIPVGGTAKNATSVTVRASYQGPPTTSTDTSAPTPAPPSPPEAVTVPVSEDGTYATPLELTAGRWAITVTAAGDQTKTASLTRNVIVDYNGITVAISIKDGRAWLKVWVDGKVSDVTGSAGRVYGSGKVLTFTGKEDVEVRTGNAAATYFTVNGVDQGRLNETSNPGTWLFTTTAPPERTDRH
jgi:cytoskeletal protein RodZ